MKICGSNITNSQIKKWLQTVKDPEIPVLDIAEMGILRGVEVDDDGQVTVQITPTYSGCPAMNAIEMEIAATLRKHGIKNFKIKKDFSEAWTTDWMTGEARRKLNEYGIAPPDRDGRPLSEKTIPCPYCGSTDTRLQAEFGATACKAQFYCDGCEQPFEHFKCH